MTQFYVGFVVTTISSVCICQNVYLIDLPFVSFFLFFPFFFFRSIYSAYIAFAFAAS